MEFVKNALDGAVLLDMAALGASLVLIGWLLFNRVRYGRLVAASQAAAPDFISAMALQAITQQSQRSYRRIQRTLQQEFENLQGLTSNDPHSGPSDDGPPRTETHGLDFAQAAPQRGARHHQAQGMLHNGAERQAIARRCGLSLGEIDLLTYMQHQGRSS